MDKKDMRTDFQMLEKEYSTKTSKGKRNCLLFIVWMLVLTFILNIGKIFQLASLIAILIGIVLSIVIWFDIVPIARFLLKLLYLLGILEEFPKYVEAKLEHIIPWFYVRKCLAIILSLLLLILIIGLICFLLALL